MHAEKLLKLFPAPKFLDTPYAGLAISDDAIHCIEYSTHHKDHFTLKRYGMRQLPSGTIEEGEIKNDKVFIETLASLAKELKVSVVKASLPEDKMYLFKTAVPSVDIKEMRQNIEFKLEENVPLAVTDALFFFDLIPKQTGVVIHEPETEANPVSVSVAPRTVVMSYLEAIKAAGITVVTFEVDAKGLARAIVPKGSTGTDLVVHIMNRKTGLYIVVGGVVCFTSTVPWGTMTMGDSTDVKAKYAELKKSVQQVKNYWKDHGLGTQISRVVFSGRGALADGLISECSAGFASHEDGQIKFEVGKIWQNAFSHDNYIPPIQHDDSLDYGVAAGLALPSPQ